MLKHIAEFFAIEKDIRVATSGMHRRAAGLSLVE
jgi:hypothetical protein